MGKIKLSIVMDIIFSFICSFILFLLILYYYVGRTYSVVLSFWLALIVSVIISKILLSKYKNSLLSKAEESKFENTMTALNFSTPKEIENIFTKAFTKQNLTVSTNGGKIIIHEKNQVYFFKFTFDSVTKTDVVKYFNKLKKEQTACICSEKFSQEVISFASRFGKRIKLIDGKKCFELLLKTDTLPKSVDYFAKKEKITFKKNLLLRKNAKKFFLFGVVFCFMSFFVPMKIYYVIVASLMLIFSLVLRLFGKNEQTD